MGKIKIVATGGTVANTADGRIHIDQLLKEVPAAAGIGQIDTEEVIRVGSGQFTLANWPPIANAVAAAVADPAYDAVLVTHGTFTSEETAFMLHLTVSTRKPVVMVCSQRKHGTLGNDGDHNLVDGLRVASSEAARGKGVLVVLDEQIHCARDVIKTNQRPSGFQSPQGGPLGSVEADQVTFYRTPLRRHTYQSEFDVALVSSLPRVDIVATYVGADGVAIRALVDAGARGLVVNGFAYSGRPAVDQLEALDEARARGVVVALANRGQGGRVPLANDGSVPPSPFVRCDNLTAQKARILLALALASGAGEAEVQRIFGEY